MSGYIAKAPVVKVSIGAAEGNRVARILREGTPIPDGVTDEQLKSLVDRGLIVEAPPTEEELAAAAEAKKQAAAATAKAKADAKAKAEAEAKARAEAAAKAEADAKAAADGQKTE